MNVKMKENLKVGVISLLIASALGGPLLILAIALFQDASTMEEKHCQKSGETRESYYIQYMYGDKGQIVGSYPVETEENKYTCDDGPRWR